MPKNPLLMAAIAAALAACSAAAQDTPALPASMPLSSPLAVDAPDFAPTAYAEHAVTCEVRVRRTQNGVVIQGRAFADTAFDGEYELVITKSGLNESEISQSGPVTLAGGRSATFGESELSFERGERLDAVLTVLDDEGVLCRRSLSL